MKIKHDFHIHTNLSICANETATLENYIKIAEKLGLTKIGISNHFWDSDIDGAFDFYKTQDFEHISKIRSEIEKAASPDLKIYFGAEAEYDPKHRDVSVTERTAERLEYLLVPNSHTHITMPREYYQPYQKHVDYMIEAYNDIISSRVSRYITAVAHPFQAVACPYDNEILINMISDDTFKRLFDKTARKGIAFEINVCSMRSKTHDRIENCAQIRMFRLAKECGCQFIFGSDAHNTSAHDTYSNAQFVAELLELSEKDIKDIAL